MSQNYQRKYRRCIKFEFPKKKNKFSHKYHPCNSQATLILKGFPGSSAGKESTYNTGDPGLTPGSGSSSGEGRGHGVHLDDPR